MAADTNTQSGIKHHRLISDYVCVTPSLSDTQVVLSEGQFWPIWTLIFWLTLVLTSSTAPSVYFDLWISVAEDQEEAVVFLPRAVWETESECENLPDVKWTHFWNSCWSEKLQPSRRLCCLENVKVFDQAGMQPCLFVCFTQFLPSGLKRFNRKPTNYLQGGQRSYKAVKWVSVGNRRTSNILPVRPGVEARTT